MVWAIENPTAGIVEADELDSGACSRWRGPISGRVVGVYGDWTPLQTGRRLFPEDIDPTDPWQFKNILVG